jgi:KOW motif
MTEELVREFDRYMGTDEPQAPDRGTSPQSDWPRPGDEVRIVGGRYHGSKGILEAIEQTPTPAGGYVFIARVRRPRAGATFTFASEVRKA